MLLVVLMVMLMLVMVMMIMVTIALMTVRTIAGEGVIRVIVVMTVIMVSIMVVVVAVMWLCEDGDSGLVKNEGRGCQGYSWARPVTFNKQLEHTEGRITLSLSFLPESDCILELPQQ